MSRSEETSEFTETEQSYQSAHDEVVIDINDQYQNLEYVEKVAIEEEE